MWGSRRFVDKPVEDKAVSRTEQLTLYDRYGAMAYGVIMQIIPQPDLAQNVLIDLFASPEIASLPGSPSQAACAIVRMARTKALSAKPVEQPALAEFEANPNVAANLPELVFDLSFNKGFKLDVIAERLELTYFDVLKAIREHVKSIRTC
ncbi:hypothetical protein [Spirosoma utsteinense]|uniref:Uncharacterized protein n=1 Tax=Spirosoma utsteinense TaxID=2585773 RepID=A0ABR6W7C8_9BACT|nr:hypothetical protein [Spirosoma utsteinense]MBC3784926.1 hypothetical protein [Spirosoma utsteinense]MBC3792487.1 hypothetical protein [Spirosoma utsteinense]